MPRLAHIAVATAALFLVSALPSAHSAVLRASKTALAGQPTDESVGNFTKTSAREAATSCSVYGWGRNKAYELLQPQGTESHVGVNLKTYMKSYVTPLRGVRVTVVCEAVWLAPAMGYKSQSVVPAPVSCHCPHVRLVFSI